MASLVGLRRYLSGVRSSPLGLAAADGPPADPDDAVRDDGSSTAPAPDVPADTRATIAEACARIAVDAYVESDLRYQAFSVARLLGGDRYAELLAELADQAELESGSGSQLLEEVKAERRRLQVAND
jgi:hypothetical protein